MRVSKMMLCCVTANPSSQVRRDGETGRRGIGQHRQRRRRRRRQPRQAANVISGGYLQPFQGRRHEADVRAADLPAAAAGPSHDGNYAEADRGRVPILSPGDRS